MKYTKTFLILTALFGGLQSSLTYADNTTSSKEQKMTMESKQEQRIIYLAGGCFWGLEAYMERIQGVTDAVSGYANGKGDTTNYQLLHATDHAETVKVTYDPNKISLDKLLQYYFRVIDPTSINKQGNDRGRQYRTGIYYQNEQDKAVIEAALKTLQSKYQEPIQIEVEPLKNYVEAADEYGVPHVYGEFGTNTYTGTSNWKEPRRGLQIARIAANMFQSGSCGMSYWMLYCYYWYWLEQGHGNDNAMGLWGNADENYSCYPVYYAYSMLTRFVRAGMEIYPVQTDDPNLVAVGFKSGEDWTYLVVNDSETESKKISFLNNARFPGAMKRYVYDQNNVPTDNKVIASNGTVTPDGRVLTDTLAPLTFTVYTTLPA